MSGFPSHHMICTFNKKEFGHFGIVSDINYKTEMNKIGNYIVKYH